MWNVGERLKFYVDDREGFREKMTFDWRPKGIEGTGQVAAHEKRIPGRGKNMCKDPKMKACWACLSDLERAVCSEQKGQGVERGEV